MKKSTEVNLTKRVQTKQGWRFLPVALTAKGHPRPDVVLVERGERGVREKGREERHPEGMYYIDWRENGKRIRMPVGKDATEAHNLRLAKEAELSARNAGVPILAQTSDRISLAAAIAEYLEEVKLTKKPKTHAAYSTSLAYFQESCHKMSVQDIERKDLLKFVAFLRDEKDQTPRSCWNKFSNVMSFLKAQGIRTSTPVEQGGLGIKKNDWPRYVDEEPEIYDQEDLDRFFAACDEDERLWFSFFLMTGMREQEVIHTYWSDVNFAHHTVAVTGKPDRGWTPKTYEEREIPIPDKLTALLKEAKAKRDKNCPLVFPTSGCHIKLDFLDCCKAVANRAKLNCHECEQCKTRGTCDRWFLHKFRATFATRQLWNGVDLRTVQHWMGHKDIESTMRYLKPNRGKEVRDKVNTTFA